MEDVKRALAVSVAARGWAALLNLAVVPVYVKLLGVEAYGLIGFFTSIQTLTTFLDLGLGATLIRELAQTAGNSERLSHGRDVTRTFEVAYCLMALMIGAVLAVGAPLLADYWVNTDALRPAEVNLALILGSIALACQWPAGLYGSGMAGLHRQMQLGLTTSGFATLRIVLTLTALAWNPSLGSFFAAQIVGALMQSVGMRVQLWRNLAQSDHRPAVKMALLHAAMGFAGGLTGITVTSIVLTQIDKLVLSHILSLADFGIYVVSGTLALGLYVLINPMFSVMYPRFASLLGHGKEDEAGMLYQAASQALAVMTIPCAVIAACFAQEILFVWTGDVALSERGAGVLVMLVIGNACNGVMHIPFALQLAAGWTTLALWSNIAAITVLAPATWWAATHFGPIGGAAIWCLLNVGHIAMTPYFVHRRLLLKEKWKWYWYGVILPTGVSVSGTALLKGFDFGWTSRFALAFKLMLYALLLLALVASVLPEIRFRVARAIREKMISSRMPIKNN